MTKKKTQWELELNEELFIDGSLTIQRVPGGWIYKFFQPKEFINSSGYSVFGDWTLISTQFVPYHLIL